MKRGMDGIYLTFGCFSCCNFGNPFFYSGRLGLIRLPDVYTRLHATGKVGLFGVVLLLIGDVIFTPLGLSKGLVLIVLADDRRSCHLSRPGFSCLSLRDPYETSDSG
jgi:hypothetical protein